jgi:hypothetical protein
MKQTTTCAPPEPQEAVRAHNSGRFPQIRAALIGLLALFIPIISSADSLAIIPSGSSESVAFARYIASLQDRNLFTESGPMALEIEAALPRLYRASRLTAIRETDESERASYRVLGMEGDGIVMQTVVAQFLKVQEGIEDLPFSSVAITPANYTFHYKGQIGTGMSSAYVFEIRARKKRDGLINGQLWIDTVTGAEVLQKGYFVKTPSAFARPIEFVRDTRLLDGQPCLRVTHVTVETREAGRGELTITELPLPVNEDELNGGSDAPEQPVGLRGWLAVRRR